MGLKNEWKTTKRQEGPTGKSRVGTFKDTSLVGCEPSFIDDLDHVCQTHDLKRSDVIKLMESKGIQNNPIALLDYGDAIETFKSDERAFMKRMFCELVVGRVGDQSRRTPEGEFSVLSFFSELDRAAKHFDLTREEALEILSDNYPAGRVPVAERASSEDLRNNRTLPFRDEPTY